jgi:hypothetical protein
MTQDSIHEIELNIQEARAMVALGKSLETLHNNSDFKKVIVDGFIRDEAIRLVHLKADPSMQSKESQETIVQQMDAIGGLLKYFSIIEHKAYLAEKAIESDQQTIAEILAEGNLQ